MTRILLVEDNPRSLRVLELALSSYEVAVARTPSDAYRVLRERGNDIDLAIVDRHLSSVEDLLDASGDEVLEFAKANYPDVLRVMITAAPPAGDLDEVKAQFGLAALLVKTSQGYGAPGIRRVVERVLLSRRSQDLDESLETLSEATRRIAAELAERRLGLQRESRALARSRSAGWKSACAAIDEAVAEISSREEALQTEASEIASSAKESGDVQLATMAILEFIARWDGRLQ
jgi:CheY-like chemotaxis protein